MALAVSNMIWPVNKTVECSFALDASYPNPSGYVIYPATFGLSAFRRIDIGADGYIFDVIMGTNGTSASIHVMEAPGGGGSGNTGNTSGGTPSGTVSAPTFTGTPVAPTGTNGTSAVTGTGVGTAAAQTFTGNALGTHAHALQSTSLTGTFTAWRIYHGAVTGGPFVVGETVDDGGGATAVVSAVGVGYLDFNSHVAALTFDATLTGGTSGATAQSTSQFLGFITPPSTPLVFTAAALSPGSVGVNDPYYLIPVPSTSEIQVPGTLRYNSGLTNIEAAIDVPDGVPNDNYEIDYLVSATTSVSAGTPSGTNGSSAVTVSSLTATAAAQTWTGDPYTPAGTNSAPIFNGNLLGVHNHTFSAIGGAGAFVEVANGTDLSGVTGIDVTIYGY